MTKYGTGHCIGLAGSGTIAVTNDDCINFILPGTFESILTDAAGSGKQGLYIFTLRGTGSNFITGRCSHC